MPEREFKINVEHRDERGKSAMRRLRAAGFVPGIYYAHDQAEAILFKVDSKQLNLALTGEARIYHVSVGGDRKNVLMKEVQYHPVTDEVLHVDFMGVSMDEIVEVAVPVRLLGRPVGVRDEGGQLHQALLEVLVSCKAGEIPPHFEIDITELHMGNTIHADDLELGPATLVIPADTVVASVVKPRGIEELEEEAEEEEEFLFDEEGVAIEPEKPEESDEE